MNHLTNRIYSALAEGEDEVLNQLEDDIMLASSCGEVNTLQYRIFTSSVGDLIINDKIHNEDTIVSKGDDDVIKLEDLPNDKPQSKIVVGREVSWTDASGNHYKGKVLRANDENGDVTTVESNGKKISVKKDLIKPIDKKKDMNSTFSKSRARKYLINKNGIPEAFGWESSLGRIAKSHPDWKLVSEYDLNAYKNSLTKKFSMMSDDTQRSFTRPYRRYAVLDNKGELVHIVDITNAKGMVMKNPGWTMVREREYRQSLQSKFVKDQDI